MRSETFSGYLTADFARLREVTAGADPAVQVPTCPDWTLDELVRHVAMVYLHKAESMRLGKHPEGWPPDHSAEPALALLDRAYADLIAELGSRRPESHAHTWYGPDQTVGFWARRMAQETVIHRVDAELAAGVPVAPIPAELALDGIDELLVVFLEYATTAWPEDFADFLPAAKGGTVHVATGGAAWLITTSPAGVSIGTGGDPDAADARVTGEPADVLLWLWQRAGDDVVTIDGDADTISLLRRCLVEATQ